MDDTNLIRGCVRFKDLPFEKIIDTKYTLQVKHYEDLEFPEFGFKWVTICTKNDYEVVYNEYYLNHWKDFECRILEIKTGVYNLYEEDNDG